MRASDPPISYIVGTPKGRLSKLEAELCEKPWQQMREGVEVKLLPREGELYVYAKSRDRVHKERAMRRRRLRELLGRLRELGGMKLKRDALLIKIGQAKARAGRAFSLVDLRLPEPRQPVNADTFGYAINRKKLRDVRRREGRYLLRAFDVTGCETDKLWEFYMQLAPSLPLSRASPCLRQPISLASRRLGSPTSKKPSKISRATWPSAPSIISAKTASKRISLWPSKR